MHQQEDSRQLESLIARFYAAFDNRNGRMVSLQDILDLFLECSVIAKATGPSFETFDPARFAEPRIALLQGGELQDFHEWETSASTELHGPMACRRSRYAKEGTWSRKPYAGAGTKLFQCIKVDGDWRILSIAWVDDDA